jgi:hypothetical protein
LSRFQRRNGPNDSFRARSERRSGYDVGAAVRWNVVLVRDELRTSTGLDIRDVEIDRKPPDIHLARLGRRSCLVFPFEPLEPVRRPA